MAPEQMMWWPWAGMWIFPMIMFAVIIVVFLFAGRRWGCWAPWSGPRRYYGEDGESETAIDILKKRYAKGEITKDEFEQMKKDILS
ncbi:MAG: SHOCT domain-containing protein [Candidatus Dadabacteria bacterium]|nr:SHOCT domain-containing protein [Candidatus Dadabacteria bacterium]NIQ13554.1 SHOCT domain-containing protein [Candidatus Dadabacteria bacterium]